MTVAGLGARRKPSSSEVGRDMAGTGRLIDGDTVLAPGTISAAELLRRQAEEAK
jgi:hypothetical protein